MSGYLELKYPFKSNLGLNPFKSWKRQWCILRPSPTFSGGILAVYCSEAGVAGACAGTVELPSGFVVRRAKSRSRPHAFAVFPRDEPRKPRVLLAAASPLDAHVWMDKISALINGQRLMGKLDSEGSLKDSYSVSVNVTEFSRKCGLSGSDSTVTVSPAGVLVSRTQQLGLFMEWRHITEAMLSTESAIHGTCVVTVDSDFHGGGSLRFSSPLAADLTAALRRVLTVRHPVSKKLSKSDGDLRALKCSVIDIGDDVRRSSWYSGPSEVSLDDLELVMSKDCKRIPEGQLSRCIAAGDLAPAPLMDDSMSDRRSLVSIASGIYEEIPDVPPTPVEDNVYCKMSRDGFVKCRQLETMSLRMCPEPMYECVADCIYGTMRRPPPLPPRTSQRSASAWGGVTRHSSLGALPAPTPAPTPAARTLPRWDRSRQAFSAFRKRLKSDSRTAVSPKSETSKDKDVETKKKKFDFTPTRHIFKSFKVSRKMKDLKITSSGLGKESKSCEFLDETEHVKTNRCSKSVECLDGNDEYDGFDADLSIEFNDDTVTALSLPQEIVHLILDSHQKILNREILNDDISLRLNGEVELILNSHEKIMNSEILNDDLSLNLNGEVEGDYMPMSPIVPQPANLEHHYIVMSPRSNIA